MAQIDMQRQTHLTAAKYETAATPPGRYGSPRVGRLRILRLEAAISGLTPPPVLHSWHRPAARLHDPNRHATPSVPNIRKYETAERPPGRYGSPRVGKFRIF